MSEFDNFYSQFLLNGIEFFDRFYACYRAQVTNTADPEKRGRIQILCPVAGIVNPSEVWVYPAFWAAGSSRGWFWPPDVGDSVWVAFERGQPSKPVLYFGGWFGTGEVPQDLGYPAGDETAPTKRGFVTRKGLALVVNEEAGQESVEIIWRKPASEPAAGETADLSNAETSHIKLEADGSAEITSKDGSKIRLDAANSKITVEDAPNGNTITLDSTGLKISTSKKVVVEGASEVSLGANSIKLGGDSATKSAVLGEDLIQWLNQHTHGTGVGPSSPPIAPATPSLTSTVVKVK